MTSKEIRAEFLRFFESKGHKIVPSAPMIVKNDPTLMFTNAGMNQFKDIFLGNAPAFAKRAADSQKCLRVSGKHNDLEEVGHDTYHHTMFEMLGNWSFGDYFKAEAIEWAWELLTKVFKLNPDRLYATVFEGSKEDKVDMDSEAKEAWLKYLPAERILLGNKHDNFWEMGDMGPCGTCSEIHIDLRDDAERAKVPGKELVNQSNPLVIEIWNLVFMQYNRKADGTLEPLPHKNVDTGMGFERLCMAMQGKKSNYDTDVFTPLLDKIGELAGKDYKTADEKVRIAMRVIADHTRAITFSIADGQLPSNVKAGYVIRRILRRAVRYAYTFLGVKEPLLYRLVPTLVAQMGDAYPEIKKQQQLIEKVTKEEEDAFLKTLDRGIKMMDDLVAKCKTKEGSSAEISGTDAFVLYDTFGFPIDLTELIAKENGLTVDLKGFEVELGKQKARSRNAESKKEGDWIEVHPYSEPVFTGYDVTVEHGVKILKYRSVKTKGKEVYHIVLDKTPFYAESGGQVGDTGYIVAENNSATQNANTTQNANATQNNIPVGSIKILNTIKENGLSIHVADKLPDDVNTLFTAQIDENKRLRTTANHSATHLLDFALRKVLGTHIEQKGSYVDSHVLRFDFSHFEKVSPEKLRETEKIVNAMIRADYEKDERRNVPIEEARKSGAIALFGEKYGNKVRIIKFGDSVEFCGGTHIASTGRIGYFKILSESAIAAGVRRIEATTGEGAEEVEYSLEDLMISIKDLFNNAPNVIENIKKLLSDNEQFKKEAEQMVKEKSAEMKNKIMASAQHVGGIDLMVLKGMYPAEIVKNIAFMIKAEAKHSVFIGASNYGDKPTLTLMYTDDIVNQGFNAGKDIREAAKFIQGGGGGQPFFASAGGKNVDGLEAAVECLIKIIKK
jgi:alanyl-tRNA synthetase